MRTLFLQMFLAFWIVTIGTFVVATALNPDGEHGNLENIFAFAQDDAAHVNQLVALAYQHHGCKGLAIFNGRSPEEPSPDNHYLLASAEGVPFCSETLSPKVLSLIHAALQQNELKAIHDGNLWITITPILFEQQRFAVLHIGRYVPRPYFPHLPAVALPVSLFVTFIFAFVLTKPVRALSNAFTRFSNGDLSVRLPVERRRWSGLGGSDVRSLMDDFNQMADRISSLVQAQKTLVRDVSHELRSPLARLRLALEMAREESPAALSSFDRMEMEAERVNDLIGQMLTLSLMESTGHISSKERIDVGELLESLQPDLEFEATARNASIALSRGQQPYLVIGNSELLRRAIENIARNAVRFTRESTTVEIAVRTEEDKASRAQNKAREIVIEIADRGPGVPEESLDLIFRAFYRTDSARRDSTGGFGVGLSIAERAIHLHQGRLSASNRPGGGLVVAIHLPEFTGDDLTQL